jgi:hypothetical protein
MYLRGETGHLTVDGVAVLPPSGRTMASVAEHAAAGDAAARPPGEGAVTDASDGRLDEIDAAILGQLRAAYALADPPPADLDERVRFAIALADVDIEVARLQEDLLVGSGARGGERARTITFDAQSLTILVTVMDLPNGLVRLDGWLAPPAPRTVELRLAASPGPSAAPRLVTADDRGRFVFADVGRGLAQLVVHPAAGVAVEPGTSVVTPSWLL